MINFILNLGISWDVKIVIRNSRTDYYEIILLRGMFSELDQKMKPSDYYI